MLNKYLGNVKLHNSCALGIQVIDEAKQGVNYNFVVSPRLIVSPPVLLLPKLGSF